MLADRGMNTQVKVEVGSDTNIGSCDDEYNNNQGPGIKATPGTLDRVGLEECQAKYASQERTKKPHIQVRGQGLQISSALEDFINP